LSHLELANFIDSFCGKEAKVDVLLKHFLVKHSQIDFYQFTRLIQETGPGI